MIHPYSIASFLRYCILLCWTALLVPLSSFGKEATAQVFKIATLAPDRSVWLNSYNTIARKIRERTNGQVQFKCYPGGIQGDELTVIRKMRIGQLHGSGFTGNGLAQICNDALALQLPCQFNSAAEANYVLREMNEHLRQLCLRNGFEVLGWPSIGFSYLFSRIPVRDITSLRTGKPWQIENDIISRALYDELGISAVPAQVGDVITALRTGLIDTIFSPPVGMVSLQWFHNVQYQLDIKIAYSFGTFVVTKANWDRLSPQHQDAIRAVCAEEFAKLDEKVEKQNSEALNVMRQSKIQTVVVTDEGQREFRDVSLKVADQLIGKVYTKESIAMVRAFLAKYRESQKPLP